MKKEDFAHLTDAQIVEYFRDASIRRAHCGFNVTKANRICDHEMGPAYEALAGRGETSLRELLLLTNDPSSNVREDTAIFAFNVDPRLCRKVLKHLIGEPGWVGIAATVWLVDKDPEFRAEYEHNGQRNYEKF